MKKLAKSAIPENHTLNDFKCFGPSATKDGEFTGTKIADFGCFTQDGKDSNKYYHASVCQSTLNNKWYCYFQWGRVGQSNFDYQFLECTSEYEAEVEYVKQCRSKNDKRGEWIEHKDLGKILRAKVGKDCYLVRNMATRISGLPDACKISTKKPSVSKKNFFDSETEKLLSDLQTGTIAYTRSSFASGQVPDLESIEQGRKILSLIGKKKYKDDKELSELTNMLYSKIPKATSIGENISLSSNNIKGWYDDLDAFENAYKNIESGSSDFNIFYQLKYVNSKDKNYNKIKTAIESSTRNRHSYLSGKIKILNIWEVTNIPDTFLKKQETISKEYKGEKYPLIYQSERNELELASNTQLLIHGSRTVNIGKILQTGFKAPKELSGITINGWVNGPAIYHASDYKKSCGYCSINNAVWSNGSGKINNRAAFLFLNDVILGNPFIISRPRAEDSPPKGYHSVIADTKGSFQNEEFMIYESYLMHPRYLIEFNI